MVKRKELSVEKRAQIIISRQQGNSYRDIAEILKASLGAVQKAIARNRETGVNTDRKRSGRPRKTTQRVDNKIYAISKADRLKSAPNIRTEINEVLDSPLSLIAVKRRLREKGMLGRIAVKNHFFAQQTS